MLARLAIMKYFKHVWLTSLLIGIYFLIPSIATAQVMFLEPPEVNSPEIGNPLTIVVKIKGVKNLVGVQFDLLYDKTALEFKKVSKGDFLDSPSNEAFFLQPKVEPSGRLKDVALTRLAAKVGADGDGTLAEIRFTVLVVKASELKLDAVKILDPDNKDIKVTLQGSKVTAPPKPSIIKPTGKLPAIWGKIKAGY